MFFYLLLFTYFYTIIKLTNIKEHESKIVHFRSVIGN